MYVCFRLWCRVAMQAYGKRTFLITTFKPVAAGTEGAVSLEGTLAGVVGSIIISGFAAAAGVVSTKVRTYVHASN